MIIKYARVTQINEQGYFVTFLGENKQSTMKYVKLATYAPIVGDMVAFIVDDKGKYLCLGKVN